MSTLPLYVAYLGTAVGLLILFTAIYMQITPWAELALIRDGNSAAAISLGGTLIGFGLVLGASAEHSQDLVDMALWGAVSLAGQVLAFLAATLLFRELRHGIEAGKLSYGIILGAMSVAVGIINAGSLTY